MPELTRNDLETLAAGALLAASNGFNEVKDHGTIPGMNHAMMIGPIAQAFVTAALKEHSGEEILKALLEVE